MKRTKLRKVLTMIMVFSLLISSVTFAQETKVNESNSKVGGIKAKLNNSKVLVNGEEIVFDAYTIENYNYFKLRDLAKILSGTKKQFEVLWNEELKNIELLSNKPYTEIGNELTLGDGTDKIGIKNNSKIYKDGELLDLKAYTIGNNNYFKLRDITETFDIGLTWDPNSKTIGIDTSRGYVAEEIEEVKEDRKKDYNKDLVGIWYHKNPAGIYKGQVLVVEEDQKMYVTKPSHETAEIVYIDKIEEYSDSIKIKGFNVGIETINLGLVDDYLEVNNKNYHIIKDRDFLSKYFISKGDSHYISESIYEFKWIDDKRITIKVEGSLATKYGFYEFDYDNLVFEYMGKDFNEFNSYIMDEISEEAKDPYAKFYVDPMEGDSLVGSWKGKISFSDYYLGWWAIDPADYKFNDLYDTYVHIEKIGETKERPGTVAYTWVERTLTPNGSELVTESLAYYNPKDNTIEKDLSRLGLRGTGDFNSNMMTIPAIYELKGSNHMKGQTYTDSYLERY